MTAIIVQFKNIKSLDSNSTTEASIVTQKRSNEEDNDGKEIKRSRLDTHPNEPTQAPIIDTSS